MTTITSPLPNAVVKGTITITGTTTPTLVTVVSGIAMLGQQNLQAGIPFSLQIDTTHILNGVKVLTVADNLMEAKVTVNVQNTSVDGAYLTSPQFNIVDSAGGVWTLVDSGGGNLKVYLNGAAAGFTSQVKTLLYFGGKIWQSNAANLWWSWNNGWVGQGVPDPRAPAAPPPPAITFYGLNDHLYYPPNDTTIVSQMQNLGVKAMRYNAFSTGSVDAVAALVTSLAPIKIYPVITAWPGDVGATTEAAAYAYGKQLGAYSANKLAGKVAFVEVGNEWENDLALTSDGWFVSDYLAGATNWALFRGAICGFIAGWETIDPTHKTKIAMGPAGWLHMGWYQGLWDGAAPDGSTGHPQVRWDITPWHWYLDMGDITNVKGHNVLAELKTRFGKPIIISECGVQRNETEAQAQAWANSFLAQMVTLAPTYNIQHVSWYSRVDDQQTCGIYVKDGITAKARLQTLKDFITKNPMP